MTYRIKVVPVGNRWLWTLSENGFIWWYDYSATEAWARQDAERTMKSLPDAPDFPVSPQVHPRRSRLHPPPGHVEPRA